MPIVCALQSGAHLMSTMRSDASVLRRMSPSRTPAVANAAPCKRSSVSVPGCGFPGVARSAVYAVPQPGIPMERKRHPRHPCPGPMGYSSLQPETTHPWGRSRARAHSTRRERSGHRRIWGTTWERPSDRPRTPGQLSSELSDSRWHRAPPQPCALQRGSRIPAGGGRIARSCPARFHSRRRLAEASRRWRAARRGRS